MLPKKSYFAHAENEKKHHRKHRDKPEPEPRAVDHDDTWCQNRYNKWTRLMDAATKDAKTPDKAWNVMIAYMRCAIEETQKTKVAFMNYAFDKMDANDLDRYLADYNECTFPYPTDFIKNTYENMKKYEVEYVISYGFICGQLYFHGIQLVMHNGCTYHTELLYNVHKLEEVCYDFMCLLYRCHKGFGISPDTMKPPTLPDYITKNTGDNIAFIRDYLIIRGFQDFVKGMAGMLAFQKRKQKLKIEIPPK